MMDNNENNSNHQIVYHKWYIDEANNFKTFLTDEQMGKLFFAIMETAKNFGNEIEVDEDIRQVYKSNLINVKKACNSYLSTCEKRSEAGKISAKKRSQKQSSESRIDDISNVVSNEFKLPTKTEFKNMAKSMVKMQNSYLLFLDYDDYSITELYNEITSNNKWRTIPIVNEKMLQLICYVTLADIYRKKKDDEYYHNSCSDFLRDFYSFNNEYLTYYADEEECDLFNYGLVDLETVLDGIFSETDGFPKKHYIYSYVEQIREYFQQLQEKQ